MGKINGKYLVRFGISLALEFAEKISFNSEKLEGTFREIYKKEMVVDYNYIFHRKILLLHSYVLFFLPLFICW